MPTGRIKYLNCLTGLGAIVPDDSVFEIIFHKDNLVPGVRDPAKGDRVQFTIAHRSDGPPRAEMVRRIIGQ